MSIVFLDRDGTLIDAVTTTEVPGSIETIEHLQLRDGVVEACKMLKSAGFTLVMVTNQPDIKRGKTSAMSVNKINNHLVASCALDLVVVCPHDDDDECDCRKPKTGMLTRAAELYGITLDRNSVIIGDRWRDIDCGNNAGITTIHINGGHDEPLNTSPDYSALSILEASSWIMNNLGGIDDKHQ